MEKSDKNTAYRSDTPSTHRAAQSEDNVSINGKGCAGGLQTAFCHNRRPTSEVLCLSPTSCVCNIFNLGEEKAYEFQEQGFAVVV